jgi:calreticulin
MGESYGDEEMAWGIKTTDNGKFHELSAKLPEVIKTANAPLIVQHSVKFEQNFECNGAYIKLLGESFDAKNFGGDTPFFIAFGPDICKEDNKIRLHIDYKGKKYQWGKLVKSPTDQVTHIFTFALYPNGTYAVYLDTKNIGEGKIVEDFVNILAEMIQDPNDTKPAVMHM